MAQGLYIAGTGPRSGKSVIALLDTDKHGKIGLLKGMS